MGARTGLGVSGAVQTADAAGEDDHLPHGQLIPQAEGAVGLADCQAVLIQGSHIAVKGGVGGQVRKLTGIGPAADEVVRTVLGGHGGD